MYNSWVAAEDAPTTFTQADATSTLVAACSAIGVSDEGATLIRLGENAIFRLADVPIVVRIARSAAVLDDAAKEVAVASWLRDIGISAAEPADRAQPIIVNGRPVTFWRLIDDSGVRPTSADLASLLRQLHEARVPPELKLPPFDIFDRVSGRIANAQVLTPSERAFLTKRLEHLRGRYRSVQFTLPPSALHGDAHQGNLIRRIDGQVLLIDFERFAFGPPESDLAVTATEYLIGWHTDIAYASFCDTYGFDITKWDGFPVIRAINELKMTTWLMQNVAESEQVADEFRTRLASLQDDDAPRHWQPF